MKKVFFVAILLLSSIQFYATPDSWEEILETVLIEDDIPEWEIEQMCEELEILHKLNMMELSLKTWQTMH